MPTPTPDELDWSHECIVEALQADTWPGWAGFTGESCSLCDKTANVPHQRPGWFCPCGHFNGQSWSHAHLPHEEPDYGPTQETITAAVREVYPERFV